MGYSIPHPDETGCEDDEGKKARLRDWGRQARLAAAANRNDAAVRGWVAPCGAGWYVE